MAQIARDFGISESCLGRWLKVADGDDGGRPARWALVVRRGAMDSGRDLEWAVPLSRPQDPASLAVLTRLGTRPPGA